MNTPMTKTFPNIKTYTDTRTTKNAVIEVRNDGNEEFGMFVVMISYEQFTGGRWIDTYATHEYYNERNAFDCADENGEFFKKVAR